MRLTFRLMMALIQMGYSSLRKSAQTKPELQLDLDSTLQQRHNMW